MARPDNVKFQLTVKGTFTPDGNVAHPEEVTVKTFSIALIPGDGIGPEILREGKKVMDAVAEVAGITWQWKEYPFGAEHSLKHRKGSPTLRESCLGYQRRHRHR